MGFVYYKAHYVSAANAQSFWNVKIQVKCIRWRQIHSTRSIDFALSMGSSKPLMVTASTIPAFSSYQLDPSLRIAGDYNRQPFTFKPLIKAGIWKVVISHHQLERWPTGIYCPRQQTAFS